MEVCKYCKERSAINNSHIIPAFVYEWIKNTAPTKYLRSTNEPNLRQQDGLKSALLCIECENKFSKIEDEFKKQYFTKVANYRKPCPEIIKIQPEIIKCIYIMAWRALADVYYFPRENDYKSEEVSEFPLLLSKMKEVIESGVYSTFKTHIIPCTKDVLTRLSLPKIPWHMYERSVTAEPRIWDNWERFIICIQIPFSIIVFEIIPNENDQWLGTQLEGKEQIKLSEIKSAPSYVADLISYFYDNFLKSKEMVSNTQLKKMENDFKNADPNCGSFKSRNKKW